MVGFLLAVLAAMSNAASNVLQRAANRRSAPELELSWRLFADLARRPVWLAGIATVTASFLLQAAALDRAALAAVQPVIVMELPLALIVGAVVFRAGLERREWGAIALMTLGVAALIGFLDPRPVRLDVGLLAWSVAGAATAAVMVLLFLAGLRTIGGRRAARWGAASGVGFGLTAAFMRAMTQTLHAGPGALFTSWPTYAMVASGLVSMYLVQNAFHAGPLVAAQPGMTVLDPFTAIVWGVVVFGEPFRHGAALVAVAAGAAALAAGAWLLSRSPRLAASTDPLDGHDTAEAPLPAGVAR